MDHGSSNSPQSPPLNPEEALFESIGREIAAPLLVGMTHWMVDEMRKSRPEMILFLARDGKIMQALWEIICPPDLSNIPTRYVLASRRSLRIAALNELDPDILKFLTAHATDLTIEDVFLRVIVDRDAVSQALSGFPDLRPSAPYTRELEPIVWDVFKELAPVLLEQATRERLAYESYLRSLEIPGHRHLGIVDVGWHGSLQESLGSILRGTTANLITEGYYCGLFPNAQQRQSSSDRLHGYLLQDGVPEERFREISQFVEILELFFTSEDRSLLYFQMGEGAAAEPVFQPESPAPVHSRGVANLSRGILSMANLTPPPREAAYSPVRRLGLQPTAREARSIGSLSASRGFANYRSEQPFAQPGPLLSNLLSWRQFYKDFKVALWRQGFWAQLSLIERCLLKMISPLGTKSFKVLD